MDGKLVEHTRSPDPERNLTQRRKDAKAQKDKEGEEHPFPLPSLCVFAPLRLCAEFSLEDRLSLVKACSSATGFREEGLMGQLAKGGA